MDAKSLRIVFMGTPEFASTSLKRLVAEGYNIVAVVTTPDKPAGRGQKVHQSDVKLTAQENNVLCKAGEQINGHEFHYSDSSNNGTGFLAQKASGKGEWSCANVSDTLYAGYPHIHLWGNVNFARNFIKACIDYATKK